MSDAVLTLNDGKRIPQLGFGVWRLENEEAPAIVGAALEAGYRSIDTAAVYGNEAGVGRAIAASGLNREDIFVATKVWNDRHGYDETLRACEDSLARLGLDHVDLYLVHWPVPQRGAYLDTWRALMRLREDGRARSIGVSNFTVEHLKRVIDASGSTPAINQVELHPRFQQTALRAFHAEAGIVTEAWAPLGRGGVLDDPAIRAIAEKHGRTPAQVVLRWQLDIGNVAIPKSATPARIRENRDVAGFTLDADDLARITALDDPAGRMGPDPRRSERDATLIGAPGRPKQTCVGRPNVRPLRFLLCRRFLPPTGVHFGEICLGSAIPIVTERQPVSGRTPPRPAPPTGASCRSPPAGPTTTSTATSTTWSITRSSIRR